MAAILRRGPSKWVRLLSWNTSTDVITPGAWFHGRVYGSDCSLSPDGDLFAYFATKFRGHRSRNIGFAWTAVSKLPWLTALALWPHSDTWGGAVKFADNKTIVVDTHNGCSLEPHIAPPEDFTVYPRWIGTDAPEQRLPQIPRSAAYFDGQLGLDQDSRPFEYVNGKLLRSGKVIVDLAAMHPDPQRAPAWAYAW